MLWGATGRPVGDGRGATIRVRAAVAVTTVAIALLLVAGCTTSTPNQPGRGGAGSSGTASAGAGGPSTPARDGTVTPAPTTTAPPAVLPTGDPVDVVTGLRSPWSIVFVGTTALVSERDTGQVVELTGNGGTRVVGTVPGVKHGGEGGLLGLAVDGQHRLYAYSTGADGNRVQRFTLTGAPGAYGLGPSTTLIDQLPSGQIHNGGRIELGPDGMLYVGVGETGQRSRAQDPSFLGGKILRITPDGGIPADNPFPGSPVYSYGHRNVQGIGWTADGRMVASELGQDTWDELNVIVPGKNYGWPLVEGTGGTARGFVDPVQTWPTDEASPSGLAVVDGTVFVANLRGTVLRAVPVADLGRSTPLYQGRYGRIRDVVRAPDGRLWILTDNTDGRGTPHAGDDRILAVSLAPATTG